jgi:hypothetical protein
MNALVETPAMSAQTLEDVLASGDLSKLTADQRVAYYFRVCETLGLNPYTRPFDYITLNGKRVLYAKRDATDQLRQKRNITLAVTDKHIEDDLFIVTVRATDARGRSDEDFGAVPIAGLKGEARANAILKGITKAKRRVTLSICGLGMNDESEVLTIPGAITEELDLPPPTQRDQINNEIPLKAAAAATPRAPIVRGPVTYTDDQWQAWLVKTRSAMAVMRTREEVEQAAARESIKRAEDNGPEWVKRDLAEILAEAMARFDSQIPDDGAEAHEPATEDVV